jgi:hypothetical protein
MINNIHELGNGVMVASFTHNPSRQGCRKLWGRDHCASRTSGTACSPKSPASRGPRTCVLASPAPSGPEAGSTLH